MGKKQSDIPEDVNKELESPKFGKPIELTAHCSQIYCKKKLFFL